MCVGCNQMFDKKKLLRVVRTPDEEVVIDVTGKKAGRGAYLCPETECLTKAVKAKRLEKALRHPIAKEIFQILTEQIQTVKGAEKT